MNDENVKFLQDNLLYMGFGEKFNEKIKEKIASGEEEFSLKGNMDFLQPVKVEGKGLEPDTVTYDLKFKKGKEADIYFFNGFQATLEKPGQSEQASQYFYVNRGRGVSAKESFNLLSGRAVNKNILNKDDEKVNVWMKIDFDKRTEKDNNYDMKTFSKNYGFDLKELVNKSPIMGLDKPETKDRLIQSLERGNLHGVSFMHKGLEIKGFVSADPQFKQLNFFKDNLKPAYTAGKTNQAGVEMVAVNEEKESKAQKEAPVVEAAVVETAGKRKR